jgi:3-methylcrotonyl-CoA carboxylase alpha subunit
VTNLAFLGALARHAGFSVGEVDTGLIGRDLAALTAVPEAEPAVLAQAALALCGLDRAPQPLDGFALWGPLGQDMTVALGEELHALRMVTHAPGRVDVLIDGVTVEARHGANGWRFDGQAGRALYRDGDTVTVFGDAAVVIRRVDLLDVDAGAGMAGNLVEAPMPGLVRSVFVEIGQVVLRGDRLAILEAMKMEHALLAARDGTVAEVMVLAGVQVEAGAALIRLEEEPE